MIVAAWVMTTAAQCMILHCLTQGILGVHIWEMSLDDAIYETTVGACLGQTMAKLENANV